MTDRRMLAVRSPSIVSVATTHSSNLAPIAPAITAAASVFDAFVYLGRHQMDTEKEREKALLATETGAQCQPPC
jgi:hypothetical protein